MTSADFDIFLQGEEVNLAVVSEALVDRTSWYQWFNDEKNMEHMQKHYFPSTLEAQKKFVREHLKDKPAILPLAIIHKADNKMIGIVSLSSIDTFHRNCEISGFIGEVKYQKLVYFIEASKLIIKHAFDQLNMHRIYGGSINPDVITLFCRVLNFKREGTRRSEVYKNGVYHDVPQIGLLRDEYYNKS